MARNDLLKIPFSATFWLRRKPSRNSVVSCMEHTLSTALSISQSLPFVLLFSGVCADAHVQVCVWRWEVSLGSNSSGAVSFVFSNRVPHWPGAHHVSQWTPRTCLSASSGQAHIIMPSFSQKFWELTRVLCLCYRRFTEWVLSQPLFAFFMSIHRESAPP